MAGVRFFLYLLLFLVLSFFGVSSSMQWSENRALRTMLDEEISRLNERQARLALGLVDSRDMELISPYPLFEFAKLHGFARILVISGSGIVLNDTLHAVGELRMPEWMDWVRAKQGLLNRKIFRAGFKRGNQSFEAVLLPYSRQEKEFVLAFVAEKPAPAGYPYERLVVMLVGATIFLSMAYAFVRLVRKAQRQPAEPSEVGFVVDTFHDLVGRLKEKEAELEALKRMAEERADLIETSSENILESVSSGVISLDDEMLITKANGRAQKILGLVREQMIGKEARAVLAGPIVEHLEKRQTVERGEIAFKTPQGTLWLGFSVTPMLDPSGGRVGQVVVFTDLTELKVLERQAELRRRLSSLGEMAAGVAHEMRNPMAVIAGYSKMLSKNAPEHLKPAAQSIEKEIAAMDSIINGFLTFARPVEPMKAHLDLKELLRSSISSALAQGAGIEAVFSFEGPESIRADELLLRQAFTNIIQNAAQAMPEGGRLTVRSSVGDERAVVAVSDTGHGIPEEIKDKIFLPFYTTKEGGTGLGLAIAHGIVQSHGGTIEVDSSPSGTTFTVRLPA